MTQALRPVRLRRGLYLAPPQGFRAGETVHLRDALLRGGAPFLPLVQARLRSGPPASEAPGWLLDASGLLPVTRRFARPARVGAARLRDRAEAAALLAAVDDALEAAADRLVPASSIDLSPGSLLLAYREDTAADEGARSFDVRLAAVPCRVGAGGTGDAFSDRAALAAWLAAKGLVPKERPRAAPKPRATRPPRRALLPRAALPWAALAAEALALAAGLLLSASGVPAAMPVLLASLAALDALLLLHPRSPLALRAAASPPGSSAPPGASGAAAGAPPAPLAPARARGPSRFRAGTRDDRTQRLSTAGVVTRLGILSEQEPGTFDEAEGRRWFVLVDEFTVGRDAERADLVPDAPGVSRLHARIRRLGDAFTLEDLSSRNGTFLDDRRLDPGEERVLPERCTVRFAAAKYWFRVE